MGRVHNTLYKPTSEFSDNKKIVVHCMSQSTSNIFVSIYVHVVELTACSTTLNLHRLIRITKKSVPRSTNREYFFILFNMPVFVFMLRM